MIMLKQNYVNRWKLVSRNIFDNSVALLYHIAWQTYGVDISLCIILCMINCKRWCLRKKVLLLVQKWSSDIFSIFKGILNIFNHPYWHKTIASKHSFILTDFWPWHTYKVIRFFFSFTIQGLNEMNFSSPACFWNMV